MVAFIPASDKHAVIRVGEKGLKIIEIVKPLVSNDLIDVEE